MKKGFKYILLFGMIFTIIDQVIKILLSNKMMINESFIIVKDFFSIILVHNTGAAFSIFAGNRFLLIFIGITTLIGLILYLIRSDVIDNIDIFIYSLLIGGIVGNLIDRIVHGYVIDYLSFNFKNYFFPIFNFADVCIVVAIIIILVRMIKEDLWS